MNEEFIKRLDFIKCDIEGAELFALRGGKKTIEKYKPILFVAMLQKWSAKFNYHPNDIIRLMKKVGYHCFEINGEHLSWLSVMTDETVATNFFFLHTEKHMEEIQKKSNSLCTASKTRRKIKL